MTEIYKIQSINIRLNSNLFPAASFPFITVHIKALRHLGEERLNTDPTLKAHLKVSATAKGTSLLQALLHETCAFRPLPVSQVVKRSTAMPRSPLKTP